MNFLIDLSDIIERNLYGIITIILSIIIDLVVFKVIKKRNIKSKLCIITEIILIICSCFFIINGTKLMNHYVYADVGLTDEYINPYPDTDVGLTDEYINPYPDTDEGLHNLEIAGIINIGKLLFILICAVVKKIANGDGAKWHKDN